MNKDPLGKIEAYAILCPYRSRANYTVIFVILKTKPNEEIPNRLSKKQFFDVAFQGPGQFSQADKYDNRQSCYNSR